MKSPKLARTCFHCRAVFTPKHGNARNCSPHCMVEHYRSLHRNRQRRLRGTPPERFAENVDRDPVAILERKRLRYRRGQAARRLRLKAL
jgi:hypothetical protein